MRCRMSARCGASMEAPVTPPHTEGSSMRDRSSDRRASTCRSDRCLVETLESRRLLAANVGVSYDPDTNTIEVNGTKGSDQILISGNLNTGYTITGLNGTTVNGEAAFHIDPTGGQRANFDIDLGKGNDVLRFNNFAALAVDVDAGQGNDVVDLFNVTVFNGLDVELGQG